MKISFTLLFALALFFVNAPAQTTNCCLTPLQLSSAGSSQTLTFSWYYAGSSNCPNPTGFKIQYRPVNTATWSNTNKAFTVNGTYSKTITGLPSGYYQWRIRTKCSINGILTQSPWSAIQNTFVFPKQGVISTEQLSVSLFPNPVSDVVTVSLKGNSSSEVSMRILNMMGQEMYSKILSELNFSSQQKIDMAALPAGNYWMEIISGTERKMLKLVKQ